MMRQASLPERAAAQAPAPRATGESQFHHAAGLTFQARAESKFLRRESEETFHRVAQKVRACAIDEPQLFILIKSEYRQINFFQYSSQEGGRFERVQALQPQRFAERVYFHHDFA